MMSPFFPFFFVKDIVGKYEQLLLGAGDIAYRHRFDDTSWDGPIRAVLRRLTQLLAPEGRAFFVEATIQDLEGLHRIFQARAQEFEELEQARALRKVEARKALWERLQTVLHAGDSIQLDSDCCSALPALLRTLAPMPWENAPDLTAPRSRRVLKIVCFVSYNHSVMLTPGEQWMRRRGRWVRCHWRKEFEVPVDRIGDLVLNDANVLVPIFPKAEKALSENPE